MALEPEYQDLMTIVSPITGKRVNRYNAPYQSTEDLLTKVDMIRTMINTSGCPCVCRCVGSDALSTIGITSYDVDQAFGTEYYQRYLEYLKYCQENDITAAGTNTNAIPKASEMMAFTTKKLLSFMSLSPFLDR